MKKTIAIDMDGVIADIEPELLRFFEKDYGIKMDRNEFALRNQTEDYSGQGILKKFVNTPGFFLNLPVMPGAVEALTKLSEDFEIYIVSAAMEFPLSLPEKLVWLNTNFPFISWKNIIFCGDKSVINTDFMIDDHPRNLKTFKGTTIMFHAFHNINVTEYSRVNNWDEVLAMLKNMA